MTENTFTTRLQVLEARNAALEQRVRTLEGKRPGRKALPVVVSEEGVCGVDPESDSAVCPHASIYRRHKGCKGLECVRISQEYYEARRAAKQ